MTAQTRRPRVKSKARAGHTPGCSCPSLNALCHEVIRAMYADKPSERLNTYADHIKDCKACRIELQIMGFSVDQIVNPPTK